jgi:hypothetical protein
MRTKYLSENLNVRSRTRYMCRWELRCELDSLGSELGPIVGFRKSGEYLDHLNDYQLVCPFLTTSSVLIEMSFGLSILLLVFQYSICLLDHNSKLYGIFFSSLFSPYSYYFSCILKFCVHYY